MKKYFVLLVLLLVMPLGMVNAQDNKDYVSEWNALTSIIPSSILLNSDVVGFLSNAVEFNDGYVLTNLNFSEATELNEVYSELVFIDKNGVEKYKTSLKGYGILEIAASSSEIFVIARDAEDEPNFYIIKFDTNFNKIKEIPITVNTGLISSFKTIGVDCFKVSGNNLLLLEESVFLYDLDLNFIDTLLLEDGEDIVCDTFLFACSKLNSSETYYLADREEKDNMVIETGSTELSDGAGTITLFKDGEVVFDKKLSDYEIIMQPSFVNNHIIAFGFLPSNQRQVIIFDYEGNVIKTFFAFTLNSFVPSEDSFLIYSINITADPNDGGLIGKYSLYGTDYVIASDFEKFTYKQDNINKSEYYDSALTNDGGFIAVGHDGLIVKYDKNDSVMWSKKLDGASDDYLRKIIETSDGNFVVVGNSNSTFDGIVKGGGYDAIIAKIDEKGNLLWISNIAGSSSDYFYSVIEDESGNYVAVGYTESVDIEGVPSSSGSKFLITKFDTKGNTLWNYGKVVSGSTSSSFDVIDSNDGYIFSGVNDTKNLFVSKVDNDGKMVWEDTYIGLNVINNISLFKLDNDDYSVIAGGIYAELYTAAFLKYDEDGNRTFEKKINSWANYLHIIPTSDGGFIGCGTIWFWGSESIIVKLDSEFNVVWEYRDLFSYKYLRVQEIAKNDYVILGSYSNEATIFRYTYRPVIIAESVSNGNIFVQYDGDKGSVTIEPDDGYLLDNLSILDSNGNFVEYHEENGIYYFDVGYDDIRVLASFKAKTIIEEIIDNPNTITFFKIGFVTLILFTLYNLFIAKRFKIKKYI